MSRIYHSFDVEMAEKFGVIPAIIHEYIEKFGREMKVDVGMLKFHFDYLTDKEISDSIEILSNVSGFETQTVYLIREEIEWTEK